VDVRLWRQDGLVELVQCKQWTGRVGEPCIRDFLGACLQLCYVYVREHVWCVDLRIREEGGL
jgi:hypothetical protein